MKCAKLSPSMMCVDIARIEDTIRIFEKEKVEYLHIDIMDGEFVPNFTLGVDFCRRLRNMTDIPLDLHLMIQRPEEKMDWFDIQPGESVSVHWESTCQIARALEKIRNLGAKPMLALNPATPASILEEVIEELSGVLVMTVNPGFAGQKMNASALNKIRKIRTMLDKAGKTDVSIEADGNVSFENALKMQSAGADIFVGGTSSIFSKEETLEENILRMRTELGQAENIAG